MMMHNSEGISKLWTLLKDAQLELDAEEIADLLWLAVQMGDFQKTLVLEKPVEETEKTLVLEKPVEEIKETIALQKPVEETETKVIKTEIEETPHLAPTPPPAPIILITKERQQMVVLG